MTRDQAELERIFAEHRKKVTTTTIEGSGPTEEDWLEEINLLSGKSKPTPVFALLPDGRSIQIKIVFSIREQLQYERVAQSMARLGATTRDETTDEKMTGYALDILSFAIANPKINRKFLEENPDIFSNEDVAIIMKTWTDARGGYNKQIQSFRDKSGGTGLCEPSPVDGNDLERVGGA